MELLTDEDVGLKPAGLQSDQAVGLASDADVGLSPTEQFGGDVLSHTHQAINAVKRLTGFGDQPPADVDVPSVRSVMRAFGHEAKDAFGPDKLGLSEESIAKLSEAGWFRKEGRGDTYDPGKAFYELLFNTVAGAGDILLRSGTAVFRGGQAAVFEATGSRDLAALPEAFFGSPHPLGIPKVQLMTGGNPALLISKGPSEIPPPAEGFVRFYHGGDNPTEGGGRWVTPDPAYARDFRAGETSNEVHYVDIPKGDPIEVSARAWEDFDVGTNMEGRYNSIEVPEEWAKQLKPYGEVLPLTEAKDLGVIGPDRPPITEGTPEEAARRTVAADRASDEKITSEAIAGNAWEQRFDQFVGKLETSGDVKQLIRESAKENENFTAAREGSIPLHHVESIAEAAGVDPGEINVRGLGRELRNDNEVRIAMRLMLQVTENVKEIARDVKSDASPENLIKLQEAIMRRDLAVEQVVGLRAEWGRTGNAIQEFLRDVKDQETLNNYLKDKGRSPKDLKDIAHAIDQLDGPTAAKVLNDARNQPPTLLFWTWVNGLISGALTHTKYVAANATYAVMERGVTTPIAAMIGRAKSVLGATTDKVYFGEALAGNGSMLMAIPHATMATAKSIYAGVRMPLASEIVLREAKIARGEKVPATLDRAVNPLTQMQRPTTFRFPFTDTERQINPTVGRVIGAPGDAAMGIHTWFKILGERAGLAEEAYAATVKEGLSPASEEFWNRRAEIEANPTEAMRERAVEGAYKGTFMQELGEHGRRWQQFTKKTPGLKWIFPFSHIPVNLMKATYEYTPLAILDSAMREDIMGKNGGIAQDKAIARMTIGSAIMGYFTNAQLNGRATGDLPRDPKERDIWKLEGKQPNSILIGNEWVSYNRFGPIGNLANLAANIGYVVPHLKSEDDDAMSKATFHAAHAAARLIVNEVGMESLSRIFEAIEDEKKGVAWVSSTASSFIPFSSLLGQQAAFMDPSMREAKSLIDGIKYRIPYARETLLPKRDWLGELVPNPAYHSVLRTKAVNADPVNFEAVTLGIHPAPPQDRLGGVKLPPAMYDRYQALAGPMTRHALETAINMPGWYDLPIYVRQEVFRGAVRSSRQAAGSIMQVANPEIINQGVENRVNRIEGKKATKLKE